MENKAFISFKGSKNMIRGIEGFFEVLVLTVMYYFVWRYGYKSVEFPQYLGYGKYLLMGIYGMLVAILFKSFDSFQFGYLRLTDIVVAQFISLIMVNFITYFQLCLIVNVLIPVRQMLILLVLQAVVAVILPYIHSAIYHRLYSAHKMIMVCGTDSAKSLKFKMESRPDKYHIQKMTCYGVTIL